jgi:hypothetical protein
MDAPACAVGRLGPDGAWVGFAPSLDDGYAFVVGTPGRRSRRAAADPDDLVSLAIAYFEDTLEEPPEELAATHGDIGALVRHVAEHEADSDHRRTLGEAVDAIDDGLAADEVIRRLARCLDGTEDAPARLARRARELGAAD